MHFARAPAYDIAHVSCAAALQALQAGQSTGFADDRWPVPLSLFTEREMAQHGPFAMIKPPLRTSTDQQALWAGLMDGSLVAVTTDHSPFTLAEKRGLDNIWQSAIGAPGVEALVSGVLTEALQGVLLRSRRSRWLSASRLNSSTLPAKVSLSRAQMPILCFMTRHRR
ncbi:MAG: hypothetical protein R2867_15435 [Caldilineaceae bacterium]